MRIATFLAGIVVTAAPVFADGTRISSNGDEYSVSIEADLTTLRSLYPKARFIGVGASTEIVRDHDEFLMMTDCKTYSPFFGYGTWAWANGGFFIDFEDIGFEFPQQDAPIEDETGRCRL